MLDNNIATRLKLFFEYAGLTNSQFADACEIPRPTLSQILTGRNKKISDILIGQIHRAFPKLSILWLLFGEGDMMVSDKTESSVASENSDENDISHSSGREEFKNVVETGVNESENTPLDIKIQSVKPFAKSPSIPTEIAASAPVMRKISHITVYYDDSTFETFYPKK